VCCKRAAGLAAVSSCARIRDGKEPSFIGFGSVRVLRVPGFGLVRVLVNFLNGGF